MEKKLGKLERIIDVKNEKIKVLESIVKEYETNYGGKYN